MLEFAFISNPSLEKKRTGLAEWLRVNFVRVLGLLPKDIAQKVFLAFSGEKGDAVRAFQNVASWKALEVLYTFQQRKEMGKLNFSSLFWENVLDNARSVRNRLLIVRRELGRLIEIFDGNEVKLLSIGSGSARSVVETIVAINHQHQVEVMLIDMDPSAIHFSELLVKKYQINYTARLTGNFFRLERDAAMFNPHIVELVGLLDYLERKGAEILLTKVLDLLEPGRFIITGNILPNPEANFVTKGINWPMVYRRPEELRDILATVGFRNIRIEVDPLSVHMIAIAQK